MSEDKVDVILARQEHCEHVTYEGPGSFGHEAHKVFCFRCLDCGQLKDWGVFRREYYHAQGMNLKLGALNAENRVEFARSLIMRQAEEGQS